MKLFRLVLVAAVFALWVPSSWAQSGYTGEFIFNQGDFRQVDLLGSGTLAGGVSGNNVVISSSGSSRLASDGSNAGALNWSISIPVSAAQAMDTGTGVTTYSGNFVYNQGPTPSSVIGSGQLNGSVTNGTVTMQTVNGLLGVNGVNPATAGAGDWNTANFNWTINMPASALSSFLSTQN